MTVQVLFFGATAEIVGTRNIQIDLPTGESASSAYEIILANHPLLAKHDLRFSINQNYATGKEKLSDGDELAIFTAVSGG
jgi:molybdopterin converting factor small subunit